MSKATREQAQENRTRVVKTAARMFRERGFDGVGISELMKDAGLTHGGFYAHFPSKEHLAEEACRVASDELIDHWRALIERSPEKGLSALTAFYLSEAHRDGPGCGCIAASLGGDTPHQSSRVRTAFTQGIERFLELLVGLMPSRQAKTRRREAIAAFATMVGGIVLARAVNDSGFSREILDASRARVIELDAGRHD